MRRALGLRDDQSPRDPAAAHRPLAEPRPGGGPAVVQRREADRRTRRFVRDGEVPVVVLNGSHHGAESAVPVNRLAATETALAAERAARERAERSLHEALGTIQHLQTQVAHANLAHGEALAAERRARDAAEEACAAALVARDALQAQVGGLESRLSELERAPASESTPQPRRTRRTVVRESAEPLPEPEPVKWWLPSYKAKRRKG